MSDLPEILLVEDNLADVELTQHALRRRKLANPLRVVHTGAEALDYLYRRGAHADAVRPGLILLDLNLPGIDGHEVLETLKSDETLRSIPVVVLTSSAMHADVDRAYHAHANSYIVKPVDFNKFVEAVGQLHDYWFELVCRTE